SGLEVVRLPDAAHRHEIAAALDASQRPARVDRADAGLGFQPNGCANRNTDVGFANAAVDTRLERRTLVDVEVDFARARREVQVKVGAGWDGDGRAPHAAADAGGVLPAGQVERE